MPNCVNRLIYLKQPLLPHRNSKCHLIYDDGRSWLGGLAAAASSAAVAVVVGWGIKGVVALGAICGGAGVLVLVERNVAIS